MPRAAKKTTETEFDPKTAEKEAPQTAYTARLKLGDATLATVTVRANSDKEAKEHLERAKPTAFEGIEGTEWKVEKHTAPEEVTL